MPTVSIIIPTHNRTDMVGRAIQSALTQTFQDFEIIVVDDGLAERAEAVVARFQEKDNRIRYIQHESERGCSGAKNTGIRNATGEYVAFLDDDDAWLPTKLERQMSCLEGASKDVGFSFTAIIKVADDGESSTVVPNGIGDYHEKAIASFNKLVACTLVIRRDVFDAIGLMDESLPSHTDSELNIRITQRYRGCGVNEPLVRVTMTGGHARMGTHNQNRIRGKEMILEKHKESFQAYPRYYARHLFYLAMLYRDNGDRRAARTALKKAFFECPQLRTLLHYLLLWLPFYQRG